MSASTRPVSEGAPIRSRLATHPRLARVARSFALALPAKLKSIQEAVNAARHQDVAVLAHWLKGAGGTVGFDAFFEPARRLEHCAKQADLAGQRDILHELQLMSERIVVPTDLDGQALPVLDRSIV